MSRWLQEFKVRLRNGRRIHRVAAARDGRPTIVGWLSDAKRRMQQSSRQWSEWGESFGGAYPETLPVIDPELQGLARFFRIGAVILLMAEAALAVWFASLWSALGRPWAQVFAVSLAMLLALGCDIFARLWHRGRVPGYSYRRIRRWTYLVGGAFVAFLAGLVSTRFFAIGSGLFNLWVAGLSVAMPLLCGLLLALAWIVGGGNRYARRYEAAAAAYRQANDLLEEVEELLVSDDLERIRASDDSESDAELVGGAAGGNADD